MGQRKNSNSEEDLAHFIDIPSRQNRSFNNRPVNKILPVYVGKYHRWILWMVFGILYYCINCYHSKSRYFAIEVVQFIRGRLNIMPAEIAKDGIDGCEEGELIPIYMVSGRPEPPFPGISNKLFHTPDDIQIVKFASGKFNKKGETWGCSLVKLYKSMLTHIFETSRADWAIIMEDDIQIWEDGLPKFLKEARNLICTKKQHFYSFFSSGEKRSVYRHGTTLFYISRQFAADLIHTCLTDCDHLIDMCISRNWLFHQSTQNYVVHQSPTYIPN